MATINCPHCGQVNIDAGAFCAECGKALPSEVPSGPQVVMGNAVASTDAGKSAQAEQLRKQAGGAFGALLAVGILTLIGGIIIFALLKNAGGEAARQAPMLLGVNVVLAIIFTGLAIWARANPLPAAVVGLVLFISIHTINAVIDPTSIFLGIPVKVIIIVVLIKAVQSGVKYKQLQEQMIRG